MERMSAPSPGAPPQPPRTPPPRGSAPRALRGWLPHPRPRWPEDQVARKTRLRGLQVFLGSSTGYAGLHLHPTPPSHPGRWTQGTISTAGDRHHRQRRAAGLRVLSSSPRPSDCSNARALSLIGLALSAVANLVVRVRPRGSAPVALFASVMFLKRWGGHGLAAVRRARALVLHERARLEDRHRNTAHNVGGMGVATGRLRPGHHDSWQSGFVGSRPPPALCGRRDRLRHGPDRRKRWACPRSRSTGRSRQG
ncbi:hypothetical protein QJS66_11250 [Kocuria rhizophila]|nr:hypothetical protein QJS66_11250 [Kocuria rhizophila]